jgi:hypothetical protein
VEARPLGALQLVHGAVGGVFIGTPAVEAGGVPESLSLELVVADLDHHT